MHVRLPAIVGHVKREFIDQQSLACRRGFGYAARIFAVAHNESTVAVVPSIPSSDTVTDVIVQATDMGCAGLLFDERQAMAGSAGYEVTLPDADSALSDCDSPADRHHDGDRHGG